jgi:dienelactone hydrolase
MRATPGPWASTRATRASSSRAAALLGLGLLLGAACGESPSAPSAAGTPSGGGAFFESAGARLNYALDMPRGNGPFPGVVICHGSGRVTKEDGASYVPPLLARGFAVLRYDKRGVGQSTGTYRGVSAENSVAQIAELAGDLAAGAAFLASRPGIDGRRIGLLGTSQAGWVMVAAAADSDEVRFVVAVTGSVLPVGENIFYEDLRGLPIEDAYARLPGFQGFPGYDPLPSLTILGVPTLWLLGAEDRLVPTRECVRILDQLRAAGRPVDFVVYPDGQHSLPGVSFWADVDSFLGRHALH